MCVIQALTRLNAPKVHTEWRQRMRNAKLAELQAEAERMQARHAHAMHIRNVALQVTTPLLASQSTLLSYAMSKACICSIQCSLGLCARREHAALLAAKALDVELQEAENQHVEAHEAHVRVLDSLIEMQSQRLNAAVAKYEQDRKVRKTSCHCHSQ